MTEAEWLACGDPDKMIRFLGDRISRRKLRWFAIACCRLLWEHLPDEGTREALGRAERYADGLLADSTAYRWYLRADRGKNAAHPSRPWEVSACHAVSVAALPDSRKPTLDAHVYVKFALVERALGRPGQLWDKDWQAAAQVALRAMVPLLRDIVGDPFRPAAVDPAWLTRNDRVVARLARAAYDNPVLPSGTLEPSRVAVLADALEEAGCSDPDILSHCRQPGEHVRGCWLIDLLLGKS